MKYSEWLKLEEQMKIVNVFLWYDGTVLHILFDSEVSKIWAPHVCELPPDMGDVVVGEWGLGLATENDQDQWVHAAGKFTAQQLVRIMTQAKGAQLELTASKTLPPPSAIRQAVGLPPMGAVL